MVALLKFHNLGSRASERRTRSKIWSTNFTAWSVKEEIESGPVCVYCLTSWPLTKEGRQRCRSFPCIRLLLAVKMSSIVRILSRARALNKRVLSKQYTGESPGSMLRGELPHSKKPSGLRCQRFFFSSAFRRARSRNASKKKNSKRPRQVKVICCLANIGCNLVRVLNPQMKRYNP